MPKDYPNTHFYKIDCKDTNDLSMYIGHTTSVTTRKTNIKVVVVMKVAHIITYRYKRPRTFFHNWGN